MRPRPAGRTTSADTAEIPPKEVATTYGYVDIWAGLVLTGKQVLPLARDLFSSRAARLHEPECGRGGGAGARPRPAAPHGAGGDRLEGPGRGAEGPAHPSGERGTGLCVARGPDITVYPPDASAADGLLLADALEQQPWRGEVEWDRRQQGRLRCRLRTLRTAIRFSRSGRKGDVQ